MEPTQSFRLAGTTDILEIPCDQDDGQIVVYWDDILEAFPDVQYIKNRDTLVSVVKDPSPDGTKSARIKHHPGVILDIVSSTPIQVASEPVESSMLASKLKATSDRTNNAADSVPELIAHVDVINDHQVSTLASNVHTTIQDVTSVASAPSPGSQGSSANLSLKEAVAFSHSEQAESTSKYHLVPSLPIEIHTQISESSSTHNRIAQAIQNGQVDQLTEQLMACLQELTGQMDKNNELASKNNELVSQVKDLMLMNNEMASRNSELTLKITEITTSNMESTALVIKLQESFNVKQDEMKELQTQALNQLALLQSRVQILMTQTYELHEYPIPRLFVVLPQDTSSWSSKNIMSNKFRLYFLCECGDHTRRTTSKIPHHIHLAKHEGYEISRPNEFFRQYGSYILTILKMLKFGVVVAGVAIPAISQLIRVDALDKAASSLKSLTGTLQTGMDQAIRGIEKSTADIDGPDGGVSGQMEDNEALEGADLRKLETFLKNKDKNKVLGNLYRTTTPEGHVKWVCIDHYRENYHEKAARLFRDTVEAMGGSFDETIGRVNVHIRSKIQAEQFYGALENAKAVYELEIGLDWETTYNDFKKLRDCLTKSNVGAVYINLHRQDVPASDILNRGKRHDPILEIMRHPSIHSISIVGAPDDFIRRSSLQSRNEHFPNLRVLEIDLMDFQKDIPGLKGLIPKLPNITRLIMNDSGDKFNHVCGVCSAKEPFQGSLSVGEDRVNVYVRSRIQAEIVSLMLETSKSFYGLAIDLQVDLNDFSTDTAPERIQRHDSILNIMQHSSTRSAVIIGATSDFIQRSNLLSMNGNLQSIENLCIDMSALKQDTSSLRTMVSRMPKLVSLKVSESENRSHHVCGTCDAIDSWEKTFRVDGGRVKIDLGSRIQAEMVHEVLKTTTSIHGLDIDLRVRLKDGSTGEAADCIPGHDSVLDIMRRPSTHSVAIVQLPEDFIQQSNFLSQDYDFPGVKELSIDLMGSNRNIPGLKAIVSRMPNLASLTVDSENEGNDVHGSSDTVDRPRKSFEVKDGRVLIYIRSIMQLDLVYQAFETIQSIFGLDIDLTVDMKSISAGDTSERIQRHDAIFDIMRHPSAHSVTITGAPSDFIQHSSMGSRTDVFPGLKHVSLDLSTGLEQDLPGVGALVARMPNLSSLATKDSCGVDSIANPLKRPYEANDSRVKIHLWSRIQAELISHMLASINSTSGLGIDLRVEPEDGSTGSDKDRARGHDSIFDIMRHPSTHSVVLVRPPRDLIQQSSLLSKSHHFLHLKHLDIDLDMLKRDPSGTKSLLSRIPNHTRVRMRDSNDGQTQIQVGYNSMESSEEPIDGNSNRARIHLGSIALRELTDELLAKSNGAQEVDVRLYWNAEESDFDRLRDGLANTQVNGVKLHVDVDDDSDDGESTRIQRNNALFDMMGHPSIESVVVKKIPNPNVSRCDDFSSLKHLDIKLSSIKEDISTLKKLVLGDDSGSLTFQGYVDDLFLVGLYHSIAEHQKCPIIFMFRKRRIPSPTASYQSLSGHQYQSHLLSLVSIQMKHLSFNGSAEGEAAVDMLVKLARGATGLKKLSLSGTYEERGNEFLKKLPSVISRHEVGKLIVSMRGTREEEGGERVLLALEGDQWKYINYLEIYADKESEGSRAMKALMEGKDKGHGPFELDYFSFRFNSFETVSGELPALCKSFVTSTSIKELELGVEMTPSDLESMLNSMDLSRLEAINLRGREYSSYQMDRVLDCLTNAHNLGRVWLAYYSQTRQQIQRMGQRGVRLNGY
ncbi:hypothetical protein B0O80DRAFT_429326 [Mortierella sp. GBAus27b]|nr:hypothetical protein B0O80DRAFT_429326 [Mortierella sp. GBAus27b]